MTKKTITCQWCGKHAQPQVLDIPGLTTKTFYALPCSCADEKQREKEKLTATRKHIEQINNLWKLADLGPRFSEATFETWQHRPEIALAEAAARRIADDWPRSKGLFLHGITGTGKTHLAAAVVNKLVPRNISCVFTSVPELLLAIKDSYNNRSGPSESTLLAALKNCGLLVLDDIGAHRDSGRKADYEPTKAEERIFTIIDHRYKQLKPSIITSNLGPNKLAKSIGKRSVRRIVEKKTFDVFEMTAQRFDI